MWVSYLYVTAVNYTALADGAFPRFMGTLTLTWGDMRELFHNAKGGGAVIPGRSPAFHGESPYVILTSSRTLFGA